MKNPVILDFDNSVGTFDSSINIDLSGWQDRIRYATTFANFRKLEMDLKNKCRKLMDRFSLEVAIITMSANY